MTNEEPRAEPGNGGIYAILIIIVILILAAVLYMTGAFGGTGEGGEMTIESDVEIEAPAEPGS